VFDLTAWMVGPWASMMLGSLGAEVLHIERPDARPADLGAGVPPTINGTSAGYVAWNMNKRGLALDLKSATDLQAARELLRTCHVFLINMRTGVADRLGVGYETVAAINPRIVYCSITGWGETGPMADWPGSDIHLQAYSGFWTGNGPNGGPPEFYRHYAQLDPTAGNYAAQAILLALYRQRRTGRGAHLQLNMLDTSLALQTLPLTAALAGHAQPAPAGSASQMTAPDQAYRCADQRWVAICARSDSEWHRLVAAAGLTLSDEDTQRFATNTQRVQHRQELDVLLAPVIATKPAEYWTQVLTTAGLPCGRPMTFDVLKHHRQVIENQYLVEMDTGLWGQVTTGGPPWYFTEHTTRWTPTPPPGAHTEEILHPHNPETGART
jgi:crotonobetainyl-CoA:carnitine CoA-transferase CaiB-like acyl-CoA transferase